VGEAYDDVHEKLEQAKGAGDENYLETMRNRYKSLLEEVYDYDKEQALKGRVRRVTLSRELYPEGNPHQLVWDARVKGKVGRFSRSKPDKYTISDGWTANKFLKLMYQIPEMEMYLDTDGYANSTHPLLQYTGDEEPTEEPTQDYGRYSVAPVHSDTGSEGYSSGSDVSMYWEEQSRSRSPIDVAGRISRPRRSRTRSASRSLLPTVDEDEKTESYVYTCSGNESPTVSPAEISPIAPAEIDLTGSLVGAAAAAGGLAFCK